MTDLTDLTRLSASALADALARREVSSVEVTSEAFFEHAELIETIGMV